MESVNKTVCSITLESATIKDVFNTVVNIILWPFKTAIQKIGDALIAIVDTKSGGITILDYILLIIIRIAYILTMIGVFIALLPSYYDYYDISFDVKVYEV